MASSVLSCAVLIVCCGGRRAAAEDARPAPKLTGERASAARQLAGLAGCELMLGEFFIAPNNWRDDLLPDVVYLQSPQPLTPVKPGTILACWTFRKAAADQRIVTMPDLRKLSWEEAQERLGELKLPLLLPSSAAEPSVPAATGTVKDQYPRPAQKILEGTAVLLLTGE
jgi:hypothetical protein